MKQLLLLLFLSISLFPFAQCPPDTAMLVFNTQQEIDNYFANYPGCTELQNVIRIEGPDITNVNGFNGIISFGGLWIVNNPLLTNLDGFSSLIDFDFGFNSIIYIENNLLLTNLNGFANAVNDNPMDLTIKNNPQLISLNGLQGIQGVGYSIEIVNNDLIIDFSGLGGFTNMDDFYVENNDSLTSFVGLDNLGLTGSFVFINNDAMTSFASLNDITPLCGFTIRDNDNLEDIDGFVNVYEEGCEPNIFIENNPNLSPCNTDFVCSAIPYLGSFQVSNNAVGCDSIEEVEALCGICPPDGIFNSQAEIDAFAIDYPDCNSLGSLVISGSDINDLSPLSNLIAIESLKIEDNLILTSLNGLNGITEILNGIEIINNGQLINLDGLSSLSNFNYDSLNDLAIENNPELLNINGFGNVNNNFILNIYIKDNPKLVNFNGLETIVTNENTLTSKIYDLVISNNDLIVDFTGLEGLRVVSNDFTIENNDNLTSFNGLDNLIGVDRFTFINNDAMTSFSSLNAIYTECGITIEDNGLLEDLNGFEEMFLQPGFCAPGVVITNNPILAFCSTNFLCSIIQFIDENGELEVSNNAPGCNTVEEVEAACTDCPNGLTFNSQSEVDAFATNNPNCETMRYITISGNDINDLTPLSSLIYIEGLTITNNPLLTSLYGLHNVETIIGLSIDNNDQLTNLDGLSSLSNLGIEHITSFPSNSLNIRDNENLINMSMLSNSIINYFEFIRIEDNPSLLSLEGFESLEWSYVFFIRNNDALTNLIGLENLDFADDFLIEDNDGLIDLQGLNSFANNIGLISLKNNSSLISLNGLNTNANLLAFQITNNTSLTDISQLSFDVYFNDFELSGNSSLSVCNVEAICSLLASSYFDLNYSNISNNALGCNDFWQVTESCLIPPVNDEIDCGYSSGTPRLMIGEQVSGLNSYATTSPYVPSCNESTNRQDVWYYFSTQEDSIINLEVTNGFSLQLWQLSADSCEYPDNIFNMTYVPNACGTGSLQNVSLSENTTYFVQVWDNTSSRATEINDFQITLQDATLSDSNTEIESFKIFPNPFNDQIHLSLNKNIESANIYNIQGKLVKTIDINAMNAILDLSEYAYGLYFIKIFSDDFTITHKIIKQ